jgi:hypothetical protein
VTRLWCRCFGPARSLGLVLGGGRLGGQYAGGGAGRRLARRSRWIDGSATLTTVMSSSNMNAAVHTSTRVHRCRDDIPGTSAIYLTTQEITTMSLTLSLPAARP